MTNHPVRVIVIALASAGQLMAQTPSADSVKPPSPREYQAADSIVLERGTCFGTCPVYRVSVARSGDVRFVSRYGPDSNKVRQRHIDPAKFRELAQLALWARFFALPDTLFRTPYCPYSVTDLPSADVSLFLPGRQKTVSDYGGCLWAPYILRRFEEAIDETAGTRRWVR